MTRLLRPARRAPAAPTPEDLSRAQEIVARHSHASGNLALLGDKSLLFNDAGTAFLMYAVEGRSWVAMGDPIGPAPEVVELTWRFRELVDRHGGWPVFYEVSRHLLPLYLEQGLTLLKLGEEARVPLATFSLEGGNRASLRRWRNAAEKAGCTVEILPPWRQRYLVARSAAYLGRLARRQTDPGEAFLARLFLSGVPASHPTRLAPPTGPAGRLRDAVDDVDGRRTHGGSDAFTPRTLPPMS